VFDGFIGHTTSSAGNMDSFNVVDFAADDNPLGCGTGTLACTETWFFPGEIRESDTRFDSNFSWYSGTGGVVACTLAAGVSGYDVWSVATHETGHSLGLDHVPNSPDLTMYPFSNNCDSGPRTLGLGDVRGLNTLYP
jgi:Matrixin